MCVCLWCEQDLTTFVVKSANEILALKDAGKRLRHVGSTAMNSVSSRSHSIFTVTVETCETREDGTAHIKVRRGLSFSPPCPCLFLIPSLGAKCRRWVS